MKRSHINNIYGLVLINPDHDKKKWIGMAYLARISTKYDGYVFKQQQIATFTIFNTELRAEMLLIRAKALNHPHYASETLTVSLCFVVYIIKRIMNLMLWYY